MLFAIQSRKAAATINGSINTSIGIFRLIVCTSADLYFPNTSFGSARVVCCAPRLSPAAEPNRPNEERRDKPAVLTLSPTKLLLGWNVDLVDAVNDPVAGGDVGRGDLRAVDADLVVGQRDRGGLAVYRPGSLPLADICH